MDISLSEPPIGGESPGTGIGTKMDSALKGSDPHFQAMLRQDSDMSAGGSAFQQTALFGTGSPSFFGARGTNKDFSLSGEMFASMPPPASLDMPDLHLPEHSLFSAEESNFMQNFFDSLLQGGPIPEPPMQFNFGDMPATDMSSGNAGTGPALVETPSALQTPEPGMAGLMAPRPGSADQMRQFVIDGQQYVIIEDPTGVEYERLQRIRAEQEHITMLRAQQEQINLLQQQINATAAANQQLAYGMPQGQSAAVNQPPYQIASIAGARASPLTFQMPNVILTQPHFNLQTAVPQQRPTQQGVRPVPVVHAPAPVRSFVPPPAPVPQKVSPKPRAKPAPAKKRGGGASNLAPPEQQDYLSAEDSVSSASVSDAGSSYDQKPAAAPKRGAKRKLAAVEDDDDEAEPPTPVARKAPAKRGRRKSTPEESAADGTEDGDGEASAAPSRGSSKRGRGGDASKGPSVKRETLTEDQKRQNHILSEQRRRDAIRNGFNDLCSSVPSLSGQTSGASGVGSSKSVILFKAVEYLQRLQAKVQKLRDEEERLAARCQQSMMHNAAAPAMRPAGKGKAVPKADVAPMPSMTIPPDAPVTNGIGSMIPGVHMSLQLKAPATTTAGDTHLHHPMPQRSLKQRKTQEAVMTAQQLQKDKARESVARALLAAQGKSLEDALLDAGTEDLEDDEVEAD